ncbi:hypothetical protein BCR37DRAFT_348974, partial [Protomyces lactucae-debilis]
KYCGDILRRYQGCVSQNPGTWSVSCIEDRRRLTDCAEENVTSIKKVKEACKVQVKAFDDCIAGKEDPKPCLKDLKALYECTRLHTPQPIHLPAFPDTT